MTTAFIGHVLTGTHAARPSASAVPQGTLYACSTHGLIYQSDGVSVWTDPWFSPTIGGTPSTSFGSNSNQVGTANAGGASSSNSRADHVHRGVHSVAHASNTLYGDVIFTTPGDSIGISVPSAGTLAFTAKPQVAFGSNSNQVSLANAPGQSSNSSRADHVHRGVSSVSHSSNTFYGDVTLSPGTNMAITSPSSGTLTFHSTGGGAGGSTPNLVGGRATRTAGDVTTTSTSFVDLTGASITVTTGARRVLLTFTAGVTNDGTNHAGFDFNIDGTRAASAAAYGLQIVRNPAIGDYASVHISFLTDVLSAGSHTFKVQWRVGGGTGTLAASTTLSAYSFQAAEQLIPA